VIESCQDSINSNSYKAGKLQFEQELLISYQG